MSSIINNKFQMYVTVNQDKLFVHFSEDFWLHKEAFETIKVFMDNFVSCQQITEPLIADVVNWFANYLGLCFDIGCATMLYRPDFIKVEGDKQ